MTNAGRGARCSTEKKEIGRDKDKTERRVTSVRRTYGFDWELET